GIRAFHVTGVQTCALPIYEHVWRNTRRGDKYVTVIIDLTPIRDGTGPARLLNMVAGRSRHTFKAWLAERDKSWRDDIEGVAMDRSGERRVGKGAKVRGHAH